MTEEEMKKVIFKTAKHLLDNYDTLIKPDIPLIANDIKDIISMYKSGKYTKNEMDKIVEEKVKKFGGKK